MNWKGFKEVVIALSGWKIWVMNEWQIGKDLEGRNHGLTGGTNQKNLGQDHLCPSQHLNWTPEHKSRVLQLHHKNFSYEQPTKAYFLYTCRFDWRILQLWPFYSYLLICSSFNDTASNWDCTELNVWIANNKWERMQEETVMAIPMAPSWRICLERLRENHEKLQSGQPASQLRYEPSNF